MKFGNEFKSEVLRENCIIQSFYSGIQKEKKDKLAITNNGNANFRTWVAAECTVNTKFLGEKTGT
jgi:hypothetical protein